jgi:DNA-binding beta-propeller fold protein YncE
MWKIALLLTVGVSYLRADEVTTIAGNGQPGFSATQIDNPYGLTIGPDGALYFCEIGNHVVRRLDLKTLTMTLVAGTGQKGYSGDGGPATKAQLNEPYDAKFDSLGNLYIADMQNNAVRRVDAKTHEISTVAKDLKQPHCIAFAVDDALLICDIGNNRIQRVDASTEVESTFLNQKFAGPRAIEFDPGGQMYLAVREGNAIGKVNEKFVPFVTVKSPKTISYGRDHTMWVADSDENKILNINLVTDTITTVLGTGERGDGPDGDPLKCKLARPHGVLATADGTVYVADSENHRIRKLIYSQSVY